jgi:hypothetical protein
MLWRCAQGHEWESSYDNIKSRGSWCPHCRFKNESECRKLFEEFLERPFPKSRPSWLNRLELDGYNAELRIAFEYHGVQHYEYVPHFHRGGPADLTAQQERDTEKARRCDEEFIVLIVIPYTIEAKEAFILAALKELGCLA